LYFSFVVLQPCGLQNISYDDIVQANSALFFPQQALKNLDFILDPTDITITITNYADSVSNSGCNDFWILSPCDTAGVLVLLLNFGSVNYDAPADFGKFQGDYALFVSHCSNGPYIVTWKSCSDPNNCPNTFPTESPTSCDPSTLASEGFNTLLDGYSVITVDENSITIQFPFSYFNETAGDSVSIVAFYDRQNSIAFTKVFVTIPIDPSCILNGTLPVVCTTTTTTTTTVPDTSAVLNRKLPTRKTKNPATTVTPSEAPTEAPTVAPSEALPASTSLPSELPTKKRSLRR